MELNGRAAVKPPTKKKIKIIMFMEKSQALHKVHLVASGNNGSMMFYPLVTRVSI